MNHVSGFLLFEKDDSLSRLTAAARNSYQVILSVSEESHVKGFAEGAQHDRNEFVWQIKNSLSRLTATAPSRGSQGYDHF